MNLNQKLAVTTASVAVGLTTIKANPANAATITVDFTITDITQIAAYGGSPLPIQQPLSGFYSFDDTSTPVFVPPSLSFLPLNDFSFNFLDRQFSLQDISGYGGTATSLFISGSQVESDTLFTNFSIFSIDAPGFAEPRFSGVAVRNTFVYFIDGKPQLSVRSPVSVPEPVSTIGFSVLGLVPVLWKKKSHSKQQKH